METKKIKNIFLIFFTKKLIIGSNLFNSWKKNSLKTIK